MQAPITHGDPEVHGQLKKAWRSQFRTQHSEVMEASYEVEEGGNAAWYAPKGFYSEDTSTSVPAPLHKPCIGNIAHLLVKLQPGNAAMQRMALNITMPGTVTGACWLWHRKGTWAQKGISLLCWPDEQEVWLQTG